MLKLFALRVRSGDIYFSLGEVLTLNVKKGEDLERNMTAKSTNGPIPSLLGSDRTIHDKIDAGQFIKGPREYPFPKMLTCLTGRVVICIWQWYSNYLCGIYNSHKHIAVISNHSCCSMRHTLHYI